MGNTLLQKFIDLNVDEVSLVDAPANEQPFIVIKSLNQEEKMADKKGKKTDEVAAKDVVDETTAVDKKEVEKSTTENVTEETAEDTAGVVEKAMDKVVALVENISKNKEQPAPDKVEKSEKTEMAPAEVSVALAELQKTIVSTILETKKSNEAADSSDAIASISKSIGELVEAFKEQLTINKTLIARVDEIEKVRNPSMSVDDGDTDKEEEVEKSLWANVL